jgi:hypothetical protein
MRAAIVLLIVSIAVTAGSVAGENPRIHLTGNPSVDFFSNPQFLTTHSWGLADTMISDRSDVSGRNEKSPWLAGAMSALVPGTGEAYTNSYVKAAVFVAVEAASWIVAYTYNKKGDRQTDDFQAFANQHWSASKYTNWILSNLSTLYSIAPQNPNTWGNNIYKDGYDASNPPVLSPPYLGMDWKELNAIEDLIRQQSDNGFTHLLPDWNSQQFYELIGKYSQFRTGWDDDQLQNGQFPLSLPASGNMIIYRDMRAQANSYYDVASTFVSVAVINHIVSALDGFWSATRFNKNIHAEVKMRVQPTGLGVVPITEAKIRFDF